MKRSVTATELQQLVLAEIANSQRCPKEIEIRVEPATSAMWSIVPTAKAPIDERCIRRIAAIEARLKVAFQLVGCSE